jgi:hypothetical protein
MDKEKQRIYNRTYRQNHREIIRAEHRRYYQVHKEQVKAYHRKHTQKTKREVLIYYGNGKLACVKCGFNDIRALSIDHINARGREERKKLGLLTGGKFYYWLKSHNYPRGYQTLCMNCNTIKRFENGENIILEEMEND